MRTTSLQRDLRVLAGGLLGVALVLEGGRRVPVSATTVALVLLLAVLVAATQGRRWTAAVTAVVAMLGLNYFFLPPVGTFVVADPQNWVALGVFLAVAISASQLSAGAQARAREAERADLSQSLLASLSHDLRTPLTAIRIALDNLRGELPDGERQAQALAAGAEVTRLSRLVQDMLEMARVDSGVIQAERQWVTPGEVVEAALAHVRPALDRHCVHVTAPDDAEVELDPRLVSAALGHVLENAARYAPPGSSIQIVGRVQGPGLDLTVADQGPGLAPGEFAQVFERFARGREGRRRPGGTGMGLTIARGLMAAAGGRIHAANTRPAGALFTLTVPARVRRGTTVPD